MRDWLLEDSGSSDFELQLMHLLFVKKWEGGGPGDGHILGMLPPVGRVQANSLSCN